MISASSRPIGRLARLLLMCCWGPVLSARPRAPKGRGVGYHVGWFGWYIQCVFISAVVAAATAVRERQQRVRSGDAAAVGVLSLRQRPEREPVRCAIFNRSRLQRRRGLLRLQPGYHGLADLHPGAA